MSTKKLFFLCSLCLVLFQAKGEELQKSIPKKIEDYAINIVRFNRHFPQEKVYLHMDNRSYFIGDTIWFKAYVMNATTLRPTETSGVLYVELLNEKGVEVEHKKLRLENGMCHGEFALKDNYRTGYYEIRAYTRYMLNWGNEKRTWTVEAEPARLVSSYTPKMYNTSIEKQDLIADANYCQFSRVFPVYMHPEEPGKYEYEMKWYPMHTLLAFPEETAPELRPDTLKMAFFPEGGDLVEGLSSTLAFEATDQWGFKREIEGWISDEHKNEVIRFSTSGRGRGTITFRPIQGKDYKANVIFKGKTYQYKLPEAQKHGLVIHVTSPIHNSDDAHFTINASEELSDKLLGWTLLCRGKLCAFDTLTVTSDSTYHIDIPKKVLTTGVNQLTLFNSRGEVLADRLFFVPSHQQLARMYIESLPDSISPFEELPFNIRIKSSKGWQTQGLFSLSVTDAERRGNKTHDTRDIRSELLLSSDLKGFIEDVDSYFSHDNDTAMAADIDLLMMVQGWRRYEWKEMSALKPTSLRYRPEKGLDIDGYAISDIVKQEHFVQADKYKRVPNSLVSIHIKSDFVNHKDTCRTDSLGRFHFDIDKYFPDEALMTVKIAPENKNKNNKSKGILARYNVPVIHRAFSPSPTPYSCYQTNDPTESRVIQDTSSWAMESELSNVTVSKRFKKKSEIYFENPDMVIDYFKEWNNIIDRGIPLANQYFDDAFWNFASDAYDPENPTHEMTLHYSLGRARLWGKILKEDSITLKPSRQGGHFIPYYMPKTIKVYSNLMTRNSTPLEIDNQTEHRLFIRLYVESYSRKESPMQAPYMPKDGTRNTYYEGYSRAMSFYSPDYSEYALPDSADYRRTLYWNPDVWTDMQGRSSITFYNNAHTKRLHIRAEGFTRNGEFIVYDSDKQNNETN